jgi:large conductance mechanosensitive channel
MLKEFRDFLLRGNLLEVAVALVLALAFTALVTSLVEDLLTPLIAAIIGRPDFSGLTFTINESAFRYGEFLNALVSFVLIAAALFFFVIKPADAIIQRTRRGEAPVGIMQCPECMSEIPENARRCAFCTSEVAPAV